MRTGKLRLCTCAISGLLFGANHVWADSAGQPRPPVLPDTGVKQLYPQRVPKPETEVKRLFPESLPISLRGWVSGGYTFNGSTPGSHFNGPYNEVDRDRPILNQLYFIAEKKLGHKDGINFGGRVDALFGNDFFLAQSNGLERTQLATPRWNEQLHGLALPQMYAEIGNKKFSIKAGHFYTIIGYEGVPAPSNFFYSKSYSYQFAGPFTHWGGLATANITPQFTFQAGVVNGWDALDRQQDKPALIAGAKYTTPGKFFTGSLSVITGEERTTIPGVFGNRTRYSAIIKLRPVEKLEYTLHQHFSSQENGNPNGGAALWYGVDQYLYYALHKTVRAGFRFEWLHDQAGTRVSGARLGNPNFGRFAGDFYSVTGGVNYTPHPNITFRPEVRYDWFSGNSRPFNDGNSNSQVLVGINAYVQF